MTPPPASTTKGSRHFGDITVISLLISVLVLLIAYIAIRPRFAQGRLSVDELSDLTAEEVSLLPAGTLPVVLGRGLENKDSFKIQLLRLVMQRSGVPHAIGFSGIADRPGCRRGCPGQRGTFWNAKPPRPSPSGSTGLALRSTSGCERFRFRSVVVCWDCGWAGPTARAWPGSVRCKTWLICVASPCSRARAGANSHSSIIRGLRTYAAPPQYLFRLVAEQRVELFPRGSVICRFSSRPQLNGPTTSRLSPIC